jgi:radical SAM protein with 4Fe4S-binding SPASM domain
MQVSIYELSDGYSELTRSYYSYTRILENIRAIMDAGIPLTLSVLVGNHNIDSIREIHRKLKSIGDVDIFYSPYITPNRSGAGKEVDLRLSLSDMQNKLLPFLREIDRIPVLRKYRDCKNDDSVCFAGRDQISILPDGTVYPCLDLHISLGNILKQPLATILEERRRKLDFSLKKIPECYSCNVREYCDSCPGIAITENGKYTSTVSHKCDVTHFYHCNQVTNVTV